VPLELIDLRHRFGRSLALDKVSLRIERGDCYGFLGHNGAGKTTAMRIALGLLRPQRGRVRVDGHTGERELRCRTSGLIEHPGFFRELSGRANLQRLARLQGLARPELDQEVDRALDLVNLRDVAGRRVGGYSQGMRQRLGVAQALLGSPDYVLLDEPMNGLDPEGIAELRAVLLRLRQHDKHAILLSSHQLHELEGLCNRVAILRRGALLFEGETRELLREELQRYRIGCANPDAAALVWNQLGIKPDRPDAGAYTCEVDLSGHSADEVLERLVAGRAQPIEFTPLRASLEAIYLHITQGGTTAATPAPRPTHVEAPSPPRAPRTRTALWRACRYELARLRQWPTVVLFAAPAAFAGWRAWRHFGAVQLDLERVRAGQQHSATDASGYDALGLALQSALPCLVFLALGIASQALAGELGAGTLRNLLLRPLGRGAVLLGKLGAHVAALVGAYALAVVTAFTVVLARSGFTAAVELERSGKRSIMMDASDLAAGVLPALVSPLLPLLAYVGLGFGVSALTRRGVTALAAALVCGVALDLGRGPLAEPWLPSAYVPSPLRDTSHVRAFTDLAFGRADALYPDDLLGSLVSACWFSAALCLAALAFRRRAVP
jgi:ABC-type multidrug transport system ATPase subunit